MPRISKDKYPFFFNKSKISSCVSSPSKSSSIFSISSSNFLISSSGDGLRFSCNSLIFISNQIKTISVWASGFSNFSFILGYKLFAINSLNSLKLCNLSCSSSINSFFFSSFLIALSISISPSFISTSSGSESFVCLDQRTIVASLVFGFSKSPLRSSIKSTSKSSTSPTSIPKTSTKSISNSWLKIVVLSSVLCNKGFIVFIYFNLNSSFSWSEYLSSFKRSSNLIFSFIDSSL